MAKQENVYWPSDEETKIVPVEIVDEIKGSMLQYYWWGAPYPMCATA